MPTKKRRPPRFSKSVKSFLDKKQNKAIAVLKKKVKKIEKTVELKWVDNLSSGGAVSSAGTITPLTNLAVWAGSNVTRHLSREGQTVVLTSLRFKGLVVIPFGGVSVDTNNRMRVIILRTTDSAAVPAVLDILQTNNIDSFYKIGGSLRYTRMFDKTYNLSNFYGNGTVANGSEKWRVPFNVNLKKEIGKTGLKLTYSANSGTGSNPNNNGMYMIMISDSAAPTHPTIKYTSRMRFRDN